MLFRAVDIETVPDLTVWTPGEPKWEVQPALDAHPCRMSYKKVEPFPPAHAHRVVSISWCDIDMQPTDFKVYKFAGCGTKAKWTQGAVSEKYLVSMFGELQVEKPATLVTWNGRTFDLPVLAMRALHLGIPWEWYYEGQGIRYRYSTEGHCDLMDFLSDYGASRSMKLSEACRLVGLPGKTDMDGSKVDEVVKSDPKGTKQDIIARYCLQDSIQTALLFLRTRYHLGILTPAEYHASLDTFAESPFVKDAISINWSNCRIG